MVFCIREWRRGNVVNTMLFYYFSRPFRENHIKSIINDSFYKVCGDGRPRVPKACFSYDFLTFQAPWDEPVSRRRAPGQGLKILSEKSLWKDFYKNFYKKIYSWPEPEKFFPNPQNLVDFTEMA